MTEQSCRMCGCTDDAGCPEVCHWVELDLCSVCSGAIPRRRRHYTRTALLRQAANPVPTEALAIYDPAGHLVGAAWNIYDAQRIARALDVLSRTGPARLVADEVAVRRTRWQRNPIARRRKAA